MERKWYAIYTKPRWEKKLAEKLEEKRIDHYLPMVKTLKLWSDRKKWVNEPLFKSYIFVHVTQDTACVCGIHKIVTLGYLH